jgi:hypothetical protein
MPDLSCGLVFEYLGLEAPPNETDYQSPLAKTTRATLIWLGAGVLGRLDVQRHPTPPPTASQLAAPDSRVESTGALVGWTIGDEPPGIPAPGQSRCIGGPATQQAAQQPKPTAV